MDLETLKNKIVGPVFSIITPFNTDDSIDYESLGKYIHLIYDGGGRIFYVMGYNSRFSELSWDEIKALNAFVTRQVKEIDSSNIVIVADPLHCPTSISIDFAIHAKEIGADLISLIFREKHYSNQQVFKHYKMVADASGMAILVHEMPFISGHGGHTINWPIELLDMVCDIPEVIAIKEDAKNDDYSKEVIQTIKDRVAIVISGGGKRQWLQFADEGCQSWLNGIGVFDPRLAVRFYEHYKAGNVDGYRRIIEEIEVPFFRDGVSKYGWHLTIKAALEVRGIMSRYERMPMLALNDKEFEEVKSLVESLPIEKVLEY